MQTFHAESGKVELQIVNGSKQYFNVKNELFRHTDRI